MLTLKLFQLYISKLATIIYLAIFEYSINIVYVNSCVGVHPLSGVQANNSMNNCNRT